MSLLSHPDEADLAGFLDGTLSAREPVERHLASCAACRDVLADLAPGIQFAQGAVPAARPTWTWARAAGLLLAAGAGLAFWAPWKESPVGLPDLPAPVTAPMPSGPGFHRWEGGASGCEEVLGRAVLVRLEPGARAVPGPGTGLRLESGRVRVESPGEKFVLLAGGATLELATGILLVEAEAGPALSGWLREAWAEGGPALRVTLLEGQARLRLEGEEVSLVPGRGLRVEAGRCQEAPPLPDRVEAAWMPLGDPGRLNESERIFLPSAPGGYVLDVLVRRESGPSEVSVLFEVAGRGYEVPVGANLLPMQDGWTRLRVVATPGGARVTLGSQEILKGNPATLARMAWPRAPGSVGLRAWGGAVAYTAPRWRPAP